jgi:hypothetical protein
MFDGVRSEMRKIYNAIKFQVDFVTDKATSLDVTGPADATKAIVVVYDIFGYFDQTVQGADILAFSDDHQKYKVFMPDWFKGKPCPIE